MTSVAQWEQKNLVLILKGIRYFNCYCAAPAVVLVTVLSDSLQPHGL